MQGISNLLRQRLAARQAAQTHPDPDLLTAYAEQALGEDERSQVVQHLAACSYCREILSLSLPQQPAKPEQVPQPAAPPGRYWLPAFRWTALAATIAIAAALVIEKPWHKPADLARQTEERMSSTTPAPAPNATRDDLSSPKPSVSANSESVRRASGERSTEAKRSTAPEGWSANRASAPAQALGGTLGLLQRAVPEQPRVARPRSAAPVARAESQDVGTLDNGEHDYVNTRLLASQAANETVEVSAEARQVETKTAGGAALPPPPTPKAEKSLPAITPAQVAGSAFDYRLQPPQTPQPALPPAADKNNLAKMNFAAKVKKQITEGAKQMVRHGSSEPPPAAAMGFSTPMASPGISAAGADQESKRESLQFHWRLTPDGILMKSTDLSQWHEAYPQGSDLLFKSFFTLGQGRQVWAGGNNGTLIHSWNGGVNWDTFKVPEAGANDITAISIDDGWQVKTSDGQTFVSRDQGKTWEPLKQN